MKWCVCSLIVRESKKLNNINKSSVDGQEKSEAAAEETKKTVGCDI
jgi:hypothetical protein